MIIKKNINTKLSFLAIFLFTFSFINTYANSLSEDDIQQFATAAITNDVAVEKIQKFHEQSYKYWSNIQFTESLKKTAAQFNIDLSTLKEKNTEAYNIWNELVQCNQNNPSKARNHFILIAANLGLCEKSDGTIDLESSNKIQAEIETLAVNFQSFYDGINIEISKTLKSPEELKALFKNIHPLLIQLLVSQWSYFAYTIHEENPQFLRNLIYEINFSSYAPDLNSQLKIKWALNSSTLLALVNTDTTQSQCEIYGLWPKLNRSVMNQIGFSLGRDKSDSPANFMFYSVINACRSGDLKRPILTAEVYDPYYASIWKAHRTIQNAIYYNLLNKGWENKTGVDESVETLKEISEPIGNGALMFLKILPIIGPTVRALEPKDPFDFRD